MGRQQVLRTCLVACAAAGTGTGVTIAGCLADDARPSPGRVLVTATAEGLIGSGLGDLSTVDGWSIRFDRFVATLGDVELEGDACNAFSEADYLRVLDLGAGAGQKIGEVRGLGGCDVRLRLKPPQDDSVWGAGISEDDYLLLRTAGSDLYVEDDGIALYVRGHAERPGQAKTFTWAFRRGIELSHCGPAESPDRVVSLASGDDATVELGARAATLFQDGLDGAAAALRFDAYAGADDTYGDGDGEVTLEEMAQVPLSEAGFEGAEEGWATLLDVVYLGLVPRVFRVGAQATCEVEVLD